MKPPWPAHIQRQIDIEDGQRKRTWDEQKKAFGLFAYAKQLEELMEPKDVAAIRNSILRYYEQGGTSYSELQPWMAETYLKTLQDFQNYSI